MLQKKVITKKQSKKIRRQKYLYYLACAVLLIGVIYLAYFYFFSKSKEFINPLSSIGFVQNYILQGSLKKHHIEYSKIDYKDGIYTIILKDGESVILPGNKNIEKEVSSLQLILTRLKIEGKGFKNLDFRYNNPVIF